MHNIDKDSFVTKFTVFLQQLCTIAHESDGKTEVIGI